MNSTAIICQLNQLYRHFFTTERPAQQFHPQGNTFRDTLIKNMRNPHFKGTLIAENGNVDIEWFIFLYWVFVEDETRINDALHGCLWIPDPQSFGTCMPLQKNGSLAKTLNRLPIVRIERAKEKRYAELIKLAGAKFDQNPNVMVNGYENMPFRNYGLRNANITLLIDETQSRMLPKTKLFPDSDRGIECRTTSRANAKYASKSSNRNLYRTQHIYIVDHHDATVDPQYLEWEMINAAKNLVKGGYFVFDVPLYSFKMIDGIRPFMRPVLSEHYRDNGLLTLYGKTDTALVDTVNLITDANDTLAMHEVNRFYLIDKMELIHDEAFKQPVAIRVRLEIRSY